MNRLGRALLLNALTYLTAVALPAVENLHGETNSLPNAKRIVFLGDSITYGGEYVSLLESYLLTRFPERDFDIINVGLPSETVSGLSEPGHASGAFPRPNLHDRLDRVLQKLKPDLVLACYGMNDGIYYPFSDDRFAAFTNGIVRLRQKVLATGAQIIHLTPPVFDPVPLKGKTLPAGRDEYRQPYEGYDDVLTRYSEWLLAQRADGWQVIDIHGPMKRQLEARRKQNPEFVFAPDGVHANAAGHLLMTAQILAYWRLPISPPVTEIQWKSGALTGESNLVSEIRATDEELKFTWRRPGAVIAASAADQRSLSPEEFGALQQSSSVRVGTVPAGRYTIFGKRIVSADISAGNLIIDPPPDQSNLRECLSLVRKRQKLLSDAWLTEIGHSRPGMNRGLPIAEAAKQAEALHKEIRQLSQPDLLHIRIVRE